MGKLHTLRRAIERDPERWLIRSFWDNQKVIGVKAAYRRKDGSWEASAWSKNHQKFVKKTLQELGKLPG